MSGRSWICREQIPKDIQGDQHCCALVTIGSLDVGSLLLRVQTNSQIRMVARGRCTCCCAERAPRQEVRSALGFHFTHPPQVLNCILRLSFSTAVLLGLPW